MKLDKSPSGDEIRELIGLVNNGDQEAFSELCDLLYPEFKAVASRIFFNESRKITQQVTSVTHEVLLRLMKRHSLPEGGVGPLKRVFAQAAIRFLKDEGRGRGRSKRGGGVVHVEVSQAVVKENGDPEAAFEIIDALERIVETGRFRTAEVLQLRFVVGMGVAEVAEVMGISERTVKRETAEGKRLLNRILGRSQ